MQFETVLINKTLIPKDLLHFQASSDHFIYSDVLMKLLPYGKFANLPKYYHYHRNDPKAYFGDLRIHLISLIKLWIKSMANYDYQLSFKSFFFPLTKKLLKLPRPYGRGIFHCASSELKSAEAENSYPSHDLTIGESREGGLK